MKERYMNKKRLLILIPAIFFFIVPVFLMMAGQCNAAIYFLDKKLRAKGSLYNLTMYGTNFKKDTMDFRDSKFGLCKTKGTLELL